jgi:hypothetical protein
MRSNPPWLNTSWRFGRPILPLRALRQDAPPRVADLRRRWLPRVEPRGPLQVCGLAARVVRARGVGWPSGLAAEPAPLASLILVDRLHCYTVCIGVFRFRSDASIKLQICSRTGWLKLLESQLTDEFLFRCFNWAIIHSYMNECAACRLMHDRNCDLLRAE